MADNGEIKFHSDQIFAGQTGIIDYENGVIRGVSLITGGIEAEGHNLTVDDKTLSELQGCAKARGKVPVQLDHGSGISGTCGYLTGFRVDGNKLRGDLHLLTSHEETPKILERAEKMPDCFGLSVAFKGPPKGVPIGGGKMAARCEKLLSVDLVTRPAANEGLFSVPEKVDNSANNMAQENAGQPTGQPVTLESLAAQLAQLTERFNEQDQFNQQLVEHLTEGQQTEQPELTLADLYEMSDEELAKLNITRDEVNAAVEEALATAEAQGQLAGETQTGEPVPGGEGQPAGAEGAAPGGPSYTAADMSPAGATAGTAMGSLEKRIIRLEAKDKATQLRKKEEAEEVQLAEIEKKALTLAGQRNQAIEFAEKLQAENDALRVAVRTGTRPVTAGVDNGVRMFSANNGGELHEFQQRVKNLKETEKMTEAEAIRFAQKENPGLHADWVESMQKRRVVTT